MKTCQLAFPANVGVAELPDDFIRAKELVINGDPVTYVDLNQFLYADSSGYPYVWTIVADQVRIFPVGTTGQALLQIDRAKQVCNECNVRVSCLEFALETNQDSGIWGGTSEEERRNIRRQIAARNRAAQQNRIAVAPAS
ncbi:MAG: WhiB family transcriptional regulator [Actinobacteria bacterium]|nr:WhiB family transcriptional regulator [Actinomycetota bacterium]